MTQDDYDNDRVLARQPAPEHGASFWNDLEASLGDAAPSGDGAPSRTEQLPAVASITDRAASSEPAQPPRRLWPLAAAAAVLALFGIGIIAFQATDDPVRTAEVVAGPDQVDDQAPALDGPGSGDAADATDTDVTADTTDSAVEVVPTPEPEQANSAVAQPTATAVPQREFDAAVGAIGTAAFTPFDDSLSPSATFLANWDERALTWFAETDADTSCVDRNVAEISYVNGSGLVQDVRDPQLRFSGDISHFTVHPDENLAAWVVACGGQLELYVASLLDSGEVDQLNLVWLGQGSIRAALMLWDGQEINFNAIDPGGTPFAIAYDIEADVLTRNGGPARTELEAGSPVRREATPRVASADGGVSYWVGQAPADIFSACPDTFGSDQTDTLWLRYGDGTWQPALIDDTPLGRITAVAIEPTFSQIAFADVCDGQTQRLFLGTQRADGSVSNLREISLAPYVPGFASDLFWVDAQTLRIEIDNSAFGTPPIRLDFRFDDGRQEGIIVQLDS